MAISRKASTQIKGGLDPVELYRTMALARAMNDLLKIRKTQSKFPFYIGCAGHESIAALVAALDDEDWLALYYRDLAGWLQRTKDVYGPLREAYSRATGPMCAGRNMPSHYSSRKFHILPAFSEVSGLAPFAGGVGFEFKRDGSKRIVVFCTGDGGVATNDFNVLFRQATVHQLPVIMVVENNGWAITTHHDEQAQVQWAGDLVAWARAANALAVNVDGTNALETYEQVRDIAEQVRAGKGPALIHLHTGLLDPHSSSTDIKAYRTAEEIEDTFAHKDPLKNTARAMMERGYLTEVQVAQIQKEAKDEVRRAEAEVLKEPEVSADRLLNYVLELPAYEPQTPSGNLRKLNMLGAVNEALVELRQRDPGFFVYGQDVGSARGGVFGATQDLVKQFPGTSISSPLNEQVIVGVAAGASMVAGRPRCGEIQFVDYHQSSAQTLRLGARIFYQSAGDWNCPMLLRMKAGSGGGGPISDAGSGGGAFGHSNAGEQWFTDIPGLITICPSTPYDAKGLLIEAGRSPSPVVFLERGRLYRSDPPKGPDGLFISELAALWEVPEGYYTEPLGKARRIRLGRGPSAMALVTWGTMVLESAIAASHYLAEHPGQSVEIVDLRTLMPMDEEAIAAAVREANRVIVVTEEADLAPFARHVHSWITQKLFWDLDATPEVIAAAPAPAAPYNAPEELAFYPTSQDIYQALMRLVRE
ncbi:MAG TPA: thiamine pyrophosphate-dependent enzyme [Ktedonobacterales bacterium]|nr:thiamine pyrophosphate-dependent enzyme [Ktedonobacterales bacterium]